MKGLGEGGPPPIGKALVDWLEKTYPDRIPRKELSLTDLARLRGQLDVVDTLREWREAQNVVDTLREWREAENRPDYPR